MSKSRGGLNQGRGLRPRVLLGHFGSPRGAYKCFFGPFVGYVRELNKEDRVEVARGSQSEGGSSDGEGRHKTGGLIVRLERSLSVI